MADSWIAVQVADLTLLQAVGLVNSTVKPYYRSQRYRQAATSDFLSTKGRPMWLEWTGLRTQ